VLVCQTILNFIDSKNSACLQKLDLIQLDFSNRVNWIIEFLAGSIRLTRR